MQFTRWVFLRCLGAIYLIAFVSLWVQVSGLIGSAGILPAADFLHAVAEHFGPGRIWIFPTVFWLNSSDIFLHILCGAGVFFALLLCAGVAPVLDLALLWFFYLSFFTVCGDFLHFQWDTLLLETGFLAIFFAPLALFEKRQNGGAVSQVAVWLFRWLLFRLMFSSGLCKIMSGDAAWRNLTALRYHYETQPIPNPISWVVHQLPAGFQTFSALGMFFAELVAPFFIFGSRRMRIFAAAVFFVFQCLIILTGNYCFFNLLAMSLCLLLLDDSFFGRCAEKKEAIRKNAWPPWVVWMVAALILVHSVPVTAARLGFPRAFGRAVSRCLSMGQSFCFVNSYGLFAVMTKDRPEIIVEGSNDGENWLAYEFRYKPGDVRRAPPFVAPHQPRLDWQMWFAALGDVRANPWFISFVKRLLEGSPPVLALLKENPYPGKPPRFVRAVLYDYHFTDRAMKQKTGNWWQRTPKRLYCPPLSLSDFEGGR